MLELLDFLFKLLDLVGSAGLHLHDLAATGYRCQVTIQVLVGEVPVAVVVVVVALLLEGACSSLMIIDIGGIVQRIAIILWLGVIFIW